MATVTINWRDDHQTSFETFDADTIARYEQYGLDDPDITSVTVSETSIPDDTDD